VKVWKNVRNEERSLLRIGLQEGLDLGASYGDVSCHTRVEGLHVLEILENDVVQPKTINLKPSKLLPLTRDITC
jgi:hypothetical protein